MVYDKIKKVALYFTIMVLHGAYNPMENLRWHHHTWAPIPGTFYWKPKLGIDLAIPTTELAFAVNKPSQENIKKGIVVMFDGYQAGLTAIALVAGFSTGQTYMKTLDPTSAYFYTNVFRWAMRYIDMLPSWLSGQGTNFVETHKMWKTRFYHTEDFLPKWVETALFFVNKKSWEDEKLDYKRFKKHAEGAFGKHFRFPSKKYNQHRSHLTIETDEEDQVSQSIDESMGTN